MQKVTDIKMVVRVIHRLKGRADSHKNAAIQTHTGGKQNAHMKAYEDMMQLYFDLSNATCDPAWAKSQEAYRWAIKD